VFGGLGLSRSLWQVGLCLLLVGFQLGNTGIMLSTLRGAAPERRLGMVIAIFGVGPPLGIALGPVLGGLAVDHGLVTLHGMFGADGVLSFLAGLLLMLGVREMRPATRVAGRAVALAWDAVHAAFTTPTSVLLFVIFGLAYLAQQTAGPFFPLLVAHLHGTGSGLATAIGAVFGGSAVAGVLLSPAAGVIGDRVGFRPVLIGATLLGAASLALMSAAANLLELALLGVLLGAAGAAVTSMVFALLATLVPEERRTATLNLVYVPLYFAGLTGGTLGAFLVRRGLTSVLVASSLIMMAAGMVSLTRLRRREAR
jgi:MFS family permease